MSALIAETVQTDDESISELTPEELEGMGPQLAAEDIIENVESIRAIAYRDGKMSVVEDADRILGVLKNKNGQMEFQIFSATSPKLEDFQYSMRYETFAKAARARLKKSKYIFPEPKEIIEAVSKLLPPSNMMEKVRLHIAHSLYKSNLYDNGLPLSCAAQNLIKAGRAQIGDEIRINARNALIEFAKTAGYYEESDNEQHVYQCPISEGSGDNSSSQLVEG